MALSDLFAQDRDIHPRLELPEEPPVEPPVRTAAFLGRGARKAVHSVLDAAEAAIQRGEPAADVWRRYGAGPSGAENTVKFELPATGMKVLPLPKGETMSTLGRQISGYDELFLNYPDLANMRYTTQPPPGRPRWTPDTGGAVMPGIAGRVPPAMYINPNRSSAQVRGSVEHELQHLVNKLEGSQPGSSPGAPEAMSWAAGPGKELAHELMIKADEAGQRYFKAIGFDVRNASPAQRTRAWDQFYKEHPQHAGELNTAMELLNNPRYRNFSGYSFNRGEVEARNAQRRLSEALYDRPPPETMDTPFDWQHGALTQEPMLNRYGAGPQNLPPIELKPKRKPQQRKLPFED